MTDESRLSFARSPGYFRAAVRPVAGHTLAPKPDRLADTLSVRRLGCFERLFGRTT
jgi:hypothetical protein